MQGTSSTPPHQPNARVALDRLNAKSERDSDGVMMTLCVTTFLYAASVVVVRTAVFIVEMVQPTTSICHLPIELVVGCFLLDLISGIWHAVLDLSEMDSRLRYA